MQEGIPAFLTQMLLAQYGEETAAQIMAGYEARRAVTLRANTLKTDGQAVREALAAAGIGWEAVPWSEEAMILPEVREDAVQALALYERGEVYLQSLSSMIPPLVLEPKAEECILDMAAAPGGKTTQMAAISGNLAQITACEKNKIRADRLKFNLERQGASRVTVMQTDSRQLDDFFRFDKILLDAPCSGSGTLSTAPNGAKGFSKELIERSVKTQEALLKKALTLLKPGHEMVYSTCSILEKENEGVLRRVLPGAQAEIVPIDAARFAGMPLLPVTLPGTLCICPDALYEGFFVAKIRKKDKKK